MIIFIYHTTRRYINVYLRLASCLYIRVYSSRICRIRVHCGKGCCRPRNCRRTFVSVLPFEGPTHWFILFSIRLLFCVRNKSNCLCPYSVSLSCAGNCISVYTYGTSTRLPIYNIRTFTAAQWGDTVISRHRRKCVFARTTDSTTGSSYMQGDYLVMLKC